MYLNARTRTIALVMSRKACNIFVIFAASNDFTLTADLKVIKTFSAELDRKIFTADSPHNW